MRSLPDRLRHALAFEVFALLLVTPLGALVFGMPLHDVGVVSIAGASLAALWNMVFNHAFDLALRRLAGTTRKTLRLRLLHAVLFEAGLLLALMPFIAWYLGITMWEALAMDVSLALFYVVYALAFNWGYDRVFPLPGWRDAPASR